jgi:hypothetical protein
MKKPTVYLDTSIISAFWYEGADVPMLARRLHTREWWDTERRNFDVWGSALIASELRAGKFPRQAECQRMARRLRYLTFTAAAKALAKEILRLMIVPPKKELDAAQFGDCDDPQDGLSVNMELCSYGKPRLFKNGWKDFASRLQEWRR